jgi:hypothetical protein
MCEQNKQVYLLLRMVFMENIYLQKRPNYYFISVVKIEIMVNLKFIF